jgi:hypothetical protein
MYTQTRWEHRPIFPYNTTKTDRKSQALKCAHSIVRTDDQRDVLTNSYDSISSYLEIYSEKIYSQIKYEYKSSFTTSNAVVEQYVFSLFQTSNTKQWGETSRIFQTIETKLGSMSRIISCYAEECIPCWLANRDVQVAESPVGSLRVLSCTRM